MAIVTRQESAEEVANTQVLAQVFRGLRLVPGFRVDIVLLHFFSERDAMQTKFARRGGDLAGGIIQGGANHGRLRECEQLFVELLGFLGSRQL